MIAPRAPGHASLVDEEAVRREFATLQDRLTARLERSLTLIAAALAAFATVMQGLGAYLGVLPWPILVVTLAFCALYGAYWFALRRGLARPWMRYGATFVEVGLATAVVWIDSTWRGPLLAIAGGGPAVYAAATMTPLLRFTPRLSLFAGLLAAAEYLAAMWFVVRPQLLGTPNEALVNAPLLGIRAGILVACGVLAWVAARSMRALAFNVTRSIVERERVRGLFGMYVSEEIVEHILAGQVREGGERRSITVCFSDIRNFTTLSEARAPEEVLRLLNLYFERMCAVVARHGGVVNKFLGDGMLIVFGAPAAQHDDAARALAAAREMVLEAERMSASGEFPNLRIGVGLHRGEAVMGNVGGLHRQEYTVIGDTVNTASRVETLTKALGRSIVLTREVADCVGAAPLEPLGEHAVKGREAPLQLFAPRSEPVS